MAGAMAGAITVMLHERRTTTMRSMKTFLLKLMGAIILRMVKHFHE
jgi:hypothetical protein